MRRAERDEVLRAHARGDVAVEIGDRGAHVARVGSRRERNGVEDAVVRCVPELERRELVDGRGIREQDGTGRVVEPDAVVPGERRAPVGIEPVRADAEPTRERLVHGRATVAGCVHERRASICDVERVDAGHVEEDLHAEPTRRRYQESHFPCSWCWHHPCSCPSGSESLLPVVRPS